MSRPRRATPLLLLLGVVLAVACAPVPQRSASSVAPAGAGATPGVASTAPTVLPPGATPEPTAVLVPRRTPATALRDHRHATAAVRATPVVNPGTGPGPTDRVATRVVVADLGIDLAVIRQEADYPSCDVAMYLALSQPGLGGPTYLYAHARRGMFLPLLDRSKVNNGASMLGMLVEVYTGDSRRFVYRIDEVRRHVRDLRFVERRAGESLWLQTSEGPNATYPKLQVGASPVSSGPADYEDAHPRPDPRPCG